MPCLQLPAPTLPALPPGISLPLFPGLALPINLALCCQIVTIPLQIPAQAISVPFPPAVITAYNNALKLLQSYFDKLQVSCPLD